jgi:hypothetical protein
MADRQVYAAESLDRLDDVRSVRLGRVLVRPA